MIIFIKRFFCFLIKHQKILNENLKNFEKNKNPEQLVLDKEAADVLSYTLVGHLSEMEKQVLQFYMKDMNYSQIAAALGKEPKAVDNALQRIKKKLSQVLKELE